MKLTAENYYTNTNNFLSNSKVSLFKKDKRAFYDRYITGEAEKTTSTALTIGKAFDLLVTGSEEEFNKHYEMKVLKKDNAEKFEEQKITNKKLLTPTQYNEILGMYNSLKETYIFPELQAMDTQLILQYDMVINSHFNGLCGIPDFVSFDGDVCNLYDLKTARVFAPTPYDNESKEEYYMRVANSYSYKCRDYGYFRQLAMYRYLLQLTYPNITKFNMKHIVVEKASGLNYPVWVFNFPEEEIDFGKEELFDIIKEIKIETEFKANRIRHAFDPLHINNNNEINLTFK